MSTKEPSRASRLPTAASSAPGTRVRLGPAEAAVFETFVVPRYLSLFGDLALEMVAESSDAQVAHLHCRTGYPDRGIAMKLPGLHLVGVDASAAALELARAKAATMRGMVSEYRCVESLPTPLPSAAFSHAFTIHAVVSSDERARTLGEFARILAAHGQAIIAMPLRGSFQELTDLLREYALKSNDDAVDRAVEHATLLRPTVEQLGVEMEEAGFDFVDVSLRPATIAFQSGRDFFEDPITRLVIVPELRRAMDVADLERPLLYVRDAIDKYWSDGTFELTVNVGAASGRRAP